MTQLVTYFLTHSLTGGQRHVARQSQHTPHAALARGNDRLAARRHRRRRGLGFRLLADVLLQVVELGGRDVEALVG
eukprot:scaffold66801_cov46-Phaeocystis_antarctica.AAC.1